MSAYLTLRRRRQLFVDAYVRTGVGAEAMRQIGYEGTRPEREAHKILSNQQVKAAIAEREAEAIARAGARHVKFVEKICRMAYASLEHTRGPDGKRLAFADLPRELLEAAESIEFEADGSVKRLRLGNLQAMRMLGELLKAFPQVHQHTGADGGPIETKELSDLDKARRIAHLLTQGLREQHPSQQEAGEG